MSTRPADTFDYESALEACALRDQGALRSIYARESRWLLGVAQRIVRDRALAEDVLHDAFLLIWQRASTYQRALGSGRGWIYTVVRHRALDEARRRPVAVAVGDEIDTFAEAAAFAAAPAQPPADDQALDRCLQTLDERKRECIVAAFVDGYTHEQIAQRLSAPLGSVKSWIRRGLLALKACLS